MKNDLACVMTANWPRAGRALVALGVLPAVGQEVDGDLAGAELAVEQVAPDVVADARGGVAGRGDQALAAGAGERELVAVDRCRVDGGGADAR